MLRWRSLEFSLSQTHFSNYSNATWKHSCSLIGFHTNNDSGFTGAAELTLLTVVLTVESLFSILRFSPSVCSFYFFKRKFSLRHGPHGWSLMRWEPPPAPSPCRIVLCIPYHVAFMSDSSFRSEWLLLRETLSSRTSDWCSLREVGGRVEEYLTILNALLFHTPTMMLQRTGTCRQLVLHGLGYKLAL